MKRAAQLLIALSVTGCSTGHSALQPGLYGSAVIYAIPQSKALAVAREAIMSTAPRCGATEVSVEDSSGRYRGYDVVYHRWRFHGFTILRRVYVIPMTGTAASGQKINGFRFEIIRLYYPLRNDVPEGVCDKPLNDTLQAALDATGTTTTVTNFHARPS